MELLLWYKHLDEASVTRSVLAKLGACGFVVYGAAAGPWEAVRLGETKLFFAVSGRVEDHVCADLYLRPGDAAPDPSVAGSFLRVFEAAIADRALPVREASLAAGPGFEFPFFSMERFQHWLPPLLVQESDEGEQRVLRPGDKDYWQEIGAHLQFVASQVLAELGMSALEEWARGIGADLIRRDGGVLFDCGWSAWWRSEGRGGQ